MRGREAEARRNDRAVLDAARRVFAFHGPEAPVSAVAAEAGVGMGSLYRRYPSKEALLNDLCLQSMGEMLEAGQRALQQQDGWTALCWFIRECVTFRAGAFVVAAGWVHPTDEMITTAQRCRAMVEELVSQARAAGALRPGATGVDVQLLIELFSRRRPGDTAYPRLLTMALDGLAATGSTAALPDPAPTWDAYVARWRPNARPPGGP